jgi:hypothetical protein
MWQKILEFIKSGRLSEPSTYAGIAAIIVPVYALLGRTLVDDAGNPITIGVLTEMLAGPLGSIALGVAGISGLIAIFTREKPKPPLE